MGSIIGLVLTVHDIGCQLSMLGHRGDIGVRGIFEWFLAEARVQFFDSFCILCLDLNCRLILLTSSCELILHLEPLTVDATDAFFGIGHLAA